MPDTFYDNCIAAFPNSLIVIQLVSKPLISEVAHGNSTLSLVENVCTNSDLSYLKRKWYLAPTCCLSLVASVYNLSRALLSESNFLGSESVRRISVI